MASTINASTVSGLVNSADTSGILQLQTASTAALTITAAQNVGIGTASPAQKLHVSDTTTSTVKTRTEASTGYVDVGMGGNSGVFDTTATDGIRLRTSGNDRLAIDTSGNVGIGTSSPTNRLDIQAAKAKVFATSTTGTNDCYFAANNTGGAFQIGLDNSAGTEFGTAYAGVLYRSGAYPINFYTNGTERMRIASDNRVYITCTSAPSATVSGVRLGNPTEALCAFSSGAVTIETYQLGFYNGNGLVGRISTSGSATTYSTSSDYRLKETIAPMTGALAKVALLKPVTYKWKTDGSDGEGFIAHELAEVCPHAVSGEKDAIDADGNPDYQAVDTSFLVATLTAAIQELKAINDTQAETINALTARIVALESKA